MLGLSFRKDLYISTFQVSFISLRLSRQLSTFEGRTFSLSSLSRRQAFPPVPEERKPNSRLQERLLKKLGQHAHPFYFTVSHCSSSGLRLWSSW